MATASNLLVASVLVTLFPSVLFACTGPRDLFNNPMSVRQDCSFVNADTEAGAYGRDTVSGGKALDRGDGRVAQRVTYSQVCTAVEWLVFTECATGESIAIKGTTPDLEVEVAGLVHDAIANIQPPNGPIRAGRADSVEKLAKQARANDLMFEIKSESDNEPNGRGAFGFWQLYWANCGCKLYYPDSAGARN